MFRLISRSAIAAAVMMMSMTTVQAQQATRIVLQFPAGGATDTLARIVATEMSSLIGQVLVDNKPGASGIIAAEYVMRAAPDGKTLMVGSNSSLVNNTVLFAKLPYDPAKDFAPVSHLTYTPLVLWARTDLPFKTLPEMVAYAKTNSGKLNRASAGTGSITNLAGVVFGNMAGVNITHVAFAGDVPAIQSMLSGSVEMYLGGISSPLPHAKSGKLRALGVMDNKRLPDIPDVPTFKEMGYDLEAAAWFCIMAPTGTPRDAIDRINKAMTQVLTRADVVQRLQGIGMVPRSGTPDDLDRFIKAETRLWVPIIKGLGIKPE